MAETHPQSYEPEEERFSSESDEEKQIQASTKLKGTKTLTFQPEKLPWRDVSVNWEEGNQTVYFLDISQLTPGTPDITLRSGSKEGPVLGECHFKWGGSIHCGLGSDDASMEWTDLERGRAMHKTFCFQFGGQSFTMSRTLDEELGVVGYKKALIGHYKVTREGSDVPVAVYIKVNIGSRRGQLQIDEKLDPNLEMLIVLGVAAWREKMRRKSNLAGRRVC